jgi:LPXTG-site transpeptidase (sortase) family protein
MKKILILSLLIAIIVAFWAWRSYQRSEAIKIERTVVEQIKKEINDDVIPQNNTVSIERLGIVADVSEGEYESDRGYLKTWRRTHTNTPDRGGNTVIVGHRYQGKDEYPLFYIDEIVKDDIITVYWEGKKYDYKVTNTLEVGLNDIWVEDPSDEDILTLYACDWSGNNRLVVQAELL